MNKLIMYFDDNRKCLGDISAPRAEEFAKKIGYDFYLEYKSFYEDGMMRKPGFIYDNLKESESIIYADADIVFSNKGCLNDIFKKPINISCDNNGICVGFMAVRNTPETIKLMRIWKDLGLSHNIPFHDQGVMKLLAYHFSWIHDLIYLIPENVVSNPRCASPGSMAHHFWSQSNNRLEDFMKHLIKHYDGIR